MVSLGTSLDMDSWYNQNKRALSQSISAFFISFGIVLLLTFYYDFSQANLGVILFILATLGCVFIAKNAFDVNRYPVNISDSENLPLSEGLYVQLYKNSPVPYMIIDTEGHVRSANIAALRMLGLAKTKLEGINIFSKLKSDKSEHLDFLIEKYKSGVSISDELVKVSRSDMREAWGRLSLFLHINPDGQRIGLLTIVDVTRQKKAEDAKSEFVSLASHQLRTPIAGMKWSAELLQMDSPESLTPQQNKYIDRLLISIRRMAVLVDDFLRVSRFELGTFQPEYSSVSLSEVFKDIMLEQAPKIDQKQIIVKTFFDKSVDTIMTDPNLIRMIVTNLYSNAAKYTREKGTIHLGFGRKGEDVVITVADNGIGIPIGDQEEIFSKLFRAANATREVPDGTGLGLYILKEAVAVLNGNVSFTSTENIGTTFEVVLPLERIPEIEEDKRLLN